jgi:hypothetical protein
MPHGKGRTVMPLTAKASLPCASPMLHGKGFFTVRLANVARKRLYRAMPHDKWIFAVCQICFI